LEVLTLLKFANLRWSFSYLKNHFLN
jgi:hypothetical protein